MFFLDVVFKKCFLKSPHISFSNDKKIVILRKKLCSCSLPRALCPFPSVSRSSSYWVHCLVLCVRFLPCPVPAHLIARLSGSSYPTTWLRPVLCVRSHTYPLPVRPHVHCLVLHVRSLTCPVSVHARAKCLSPASFSSPSVLVLVTSVRVRFLPILALIHRYVPVACLVLIPVRNRFVLRISLLV